MRLFLLILLAFQGAVAQSQVLPPERSVDWTLAGLKYELPMPVEVVNFVDEGGVGDGVFSNNAIMTSILETHDGTMLEINFPSGTYFFDQGIFLPSNIILKGAGADSTTLLFDLGGINQHLIYANGTKAPTSYPVLEDLIKGDEFLNLAVLDSFAVGDWIQLVDNDEDLITSDWAIGTTGQIVQVKEITDDGLIIDSPLRRDYEIGNEPHLFRLDMKENIVVENLKVKRLDETVAHTNNIFFRYTNNSLVQCVKSEMTNYAHVRIEFSSNCEVRGSHFRDAHGYGGGGKAYGVVCHLTTGECLIQDNNFEHLRHSMLLQAGANGNVYAYNYSTDPFWEDADLPSNAGGDLVLHGNYVYANLFEGNTVQNIVIDHSHGINGPFNTFFRNRAELYGIFINNDPPTDSQNFIGNEITNFGLVLGLYALYGEDHFTYGNNHKGEAKPPETDDLTEETLYLESTPFYYESYSSWPPIGYPNALNDYHIEAENNFEIGYDVQCQNTYEDLSLPVHQAEQWSIYPNPTSGLLFIESLTDHPVKEIEIYDYTGKVVLREQNQMSGPVQLNIDELSDGVYSLRINKNETRRLVVIK